MKRKNRFYHPSFHAGELYLFHRSDRTCTSAGRLFGIIDQEASSVIYLESSSADLCYF